MTYIDWEYYSSLYSEILEEDFDKLNQRAAGKLDAQTHMRAQEFVDAYDETAATPFQKRVYTQIRQTMCELVHAMYEQETSAVGKGIASVSNDGYSESYKITTQAEQEAQLCALIRNGLSGSGLVGAL